LRFGNRGLLREHRSSKAKSFDEPLQRFVHQDIGEMAEWLKAAVC
jgi:hypothetical protein